MEIIINDKQFIVDDKATVGDAVSLVYNDRRGIAVAVNGKIVRQTEWGTRTLLAGDDIVIIKAAYGG